MNLVKQVPYFPKYLFGIATGIDGIRINHKTKVRFQREGVWYEMICQHEILVSNKTQFEMNELHIGNNIEIHHNRFVDQCNNHIELFEVSKDPSKPNFLEPSIEQRSNEELERQRIYNDPMINRLK